MTVEADHAEAVAAWLEKYASDGDAERLGDLFCLAFNAIWFRAKRTLGEATLTAIGDRALDIATERYPVLGSLTLGQDGIRRAELHLKAAGAPPRGVEDRDRLCPYAIPHGSGSLDRRDLITRVACRTCGYHPV